MKKLYLYVLLLCFTFTAYSQNYTILGNASSLSGCNCFQLTPDAGNQGGAIFQNHTINLNNSFDFTFSVLLGCNNGNHAADGVVFVLTSNPNGLGASGEYLGFGNGSNQPCSMGVEFDTYQNSNHGDPSYDHIAMESGGTVDHNVAGPVPCLPSSGNVDDCVNHTVRIVWDVATNTYSVYFDGNLRLSQVIPNFVSTYFCGNPVVNWGWTGATGGGTNLQQVCVQSTSSWNAGVNFSSCDPTVHFTDVSTSQVGTIASWAWNFGDGATSNQQNPTHTYAAGANTYTASLTITDVNGCANTYSHVITIAAPIVLTPTLTPPPCNGGSNGTVSVSATGGFGAGGGLGGYAYNWNGGAYALATYPGVTAGTYAVTVTDGICTSTGTYTLTQPTALTAAVTHTDAHCGANDGTATITISGGTPPYQNINFAGTYPGPNATNMPAGYYIADFHDANTCSALLQYTVTIAQLPCGYNTVTSSTDVKCFGGNDGTATATVTGGVSPNTTTWDNGGSGTTITGLVAGNYTYTYNDGNQTITGTITIHQPPVPMGIHITTIDMSCANTNDGQALASVDSGGVAPYNYAWSGTGQPNAPSLTGLSTGPISVIITDNNGCTASAAGTITGPPTLSVNVTTVDDSCFQSHTGSAFANASGGNAPYTYYWSNISSAQNDLSLGAGTYTVTVTDTRSCTVTGTGTLSQPASAVSHTIASTNVTCNGASTGTITINTSGGNPAYTYTWSPATASGANPTGLAAGQYNVTILDSHRCPNFDSATITQPAQPLTATTSHTDVTCFGASNGTVTVNVSGGTPPYSFNGNTLPPGTTTIPNLGPSTIAGNITDANGCTVPVSETILSPGAQSVSFTHVDETCFGASTGSATATFVNATGSVTYTWSNSATTQTISGIPAATYTVTAVDANLCNQTGTVTVNQPAAPVMTVTVVDATCFGANGSATANPSGGGPFSYVWSSTAATTQTVQLPAGNYTVTASDANTCGQTASFTINQPTDISLLESHTDINCFGDSTGTITITVTGGTGSPNYGYSWTPNVSANNVAGTLPAGTYSVTVTDLATCTKSTTVTLSQPAQPLTVNIDSVNISCTGGSNGSITVNTSGGTAPYSYSWTGSSSTVDSATNLSAGAYTISVTDTKGCSVTPTVTLTQPALPLTVSQDQTNLTCFNSNNGAAGVAPAGGTTPYSYNWTSAVSTTDTATGLAAGNYVVTVTDNNGCTNSASYNITQPQQLATTETHVDVLCHGSSTGSINISVSGGTPGYTYSWTNSTSTSNTVSNAPAGNYTVVVTDTNSCTATRSVTIAEPAALVVGAVPTSALCFGQSSGSIIATATGGMPNYTFATTDGTTSNTSASGQFNNLAANTYTVIVTDQNACADTTTTTVAQPSLLTDVLTPTNPLCYHAVNGKVVVTPSGGTANYNFTFSTGTSNSSGTFDGLADGHYAVTVTDANGCTITDSTTLVQPDSVLIDATPTPAEVKLGETLPISTTTNQSGSINYTWTPSFGLSCYDCANPVFSGVYSQTYAVIATTQDGCVGTSQVMVTVVPNYDVFFPNAFTPNGDGVNDVWQIYGNINAFKQIQIMIFNRIGEKVFESDDINFKWDGYYKGELAPAGVYVYTGKFVWLNNHSDANYTGTITLLK